MSPESCQRLIFSMLNNPQRQRLEQNWELDCSYGVKGLARFRVNVYEQGHLRCLLRALSCHIPTTVEVLGLPMWWSGVGEAAGFDPGDRSTGWGKSTTPWPP
jgi:twitching motility protein PilT